MAKGADVTETVDGNVRPSTRLDADGGSSHSDRWPRRHSILRFVARGAVGRSRVGRDYSGGDQASGIARPRVCTVPATRSAQANGVISFSCEEATSQAGCRGPFVGTASSGLRGSLDVILRSRHA